MRIKAKVEQHQHIYATLQHSVRCFKLSLNTNIVSAPIIFSQTLNRQTYICGEKGLIHTDPQ